MANPVLNPQRFEQEGASRSTWLGDPQTQAGGAGDDLGGRFGAPGAVSPPTGKTMTIGGTMTATGVLFALILITGAFGWMSVDQTTEQVVDPATGQTQIVNTTSFPGWLLLALFAGLGLGLVTAFVPKIARFTAPLYALAYGAVIGAVSAVYNAQWDGIVVQAVAATLAVFGVMFFLYVTRIIKVTKKYVMVVVAATLGILVMYLGAWIASLFGADIAFWNEPSVLGIGISVVIVVVAAANLGIDFAFIEEASKSGAPKYMEWYGAFGITVTMVWLYLEILRLLSLLRQ
ncbi:MAG: Bax inhibitor-1/YccA family protein [Acidimicrobiales bacterium]|jgi:uncharacterized YccA/Bax inhibitor family protein|nr:Bax inhibitor-1/YccA family protein [Acidimicrobiales bacterium]